MSKPTFPKNSLNPPLSHLLLFGIVSKIWNALELFILYLIVLLHLAFWHVLSI